MKKPTAMRVDQDIPQRPVLRVDEAAAVLTVSEKTIRAMLDCGTLDALPVGRGRERTHVRVLTASVRRLLGQEG